MKIVFFNHYHNGDIFASKGYVADLIKEFKGYEIYYQHKNSPKLLNDLNLKFVSLDNPLGNIVNRTKYLREKDYLFINTWIGNYDPDKGINWKRYHEMFSTIYKIISNETDKNIELGPIEYYFPDIHYEYFDTPNILVPPNTVIISNGPVMSGQSNLESMDVVIKDILEKTDKNIILTHYAPFTSERITFTNNVINTNNGDLNEISYLAEQCDWIIGRNSGPYFFMHTKTILNDSTKNFISIGNSPTEDLLFELNTKASHYFVHDNEVNKIASMVGG